MRVVCSYCAEEYVDENFDNRVYHALGCDRAKFYRSKFWPTCDCQNAAATIVEERKEHEAEEQAAASQF